MPLIKLNATQGLTGALPAVSGANLTGVGGTHVKIAEADYSSGVSSVTMTDCFTSTYSVYKYYLYNLVMASNDSELRVEYLDSGGSAVGTFQDTGTENHIALSSSSGGHGSQTNSGNNFIRVEHNDLDSISSQPSALELTIYQPYESSYTITKIDYHLRSDNNYFYHLSGQSFLKSTTSLRSLKISNDTGINFASYKSVIYGIQK